jgi:hypothetical protein
LGARSDRAAESGFRRPAGAASRPQFYYDLPAGPFYGFNRPGVKTLEPPVWNWWRQGMMGGAASPGDRKCLPLPSVDLAMLNDFTWAKQSEMLASFEL